MKSQIKLYGASTSTFQDEMSGIMLSIDMISVIMMYVFSY